MTILGIETSCDETSAAVIKAENENLILLSQTTATSLALHAMTGGIIPENAAREQLTYILPVIREALTTAFPHITPRDVPPIDAIAVTYGPGLIGSLLVGVETGKTLALLWNKPLIPVNHLYGHIYANWVRTKSNEQSVTSYAPTPTPFPALALVVSGGHTDLVLMKNYHDLTVIGGTRDDAAGEAFDKIGRLLGLPYPAGPIISKLAEKGNPKAFAFPRPMLDSGDFDFSFSGLKTAVLNMVKSHEWKFGTALETSHTTTLESSFKKNPDEEKNEQLLFDLCASVQQAIVDVLVVKTLKAAKEHAVQSILLGGGVAANDLLRSQLELSARSHALLAKIFVPQKSLCTDNGAMIAAAAYFNQKKIPLDKVMADPQLYY